LPIVGTYRVNLVIGFKPSLSIAKQQAVIDCLEALGPESVDCSETECTVRCVTVADHSIAASQDAETAVARALFGAGHTMVSAPIKSKSVEAL
jgi:hypothetical protein